MYVYIYIYMFKAPRCFPKDALQTPLKEFCETLKGKLLGVTRGLMKSPMGKQSKEGFAKLSVGKLSRPSCSVPVR